MNAGPRIDSYKWAVGREPALRFGPANGPVVVLALPLFEEANRTRAFGVSMLRLLAARGIGGVLPEMPGQGESELPTAELRLTDLRAAFAAAPGSHVVAVRSGALLADAARPCWQLSPQSGPELLRELSRLTGSPFTEGTNLIAGNAVAGELLADLVDAEHPTGRVVRPSSDARPADLHVDATSLWRRAEPDNNLRLAETLAEDIADWVRTCAA